MFLRFKKVFEKNYFFYFYFCFKLIFFSVFRYFDVLISKIILKNKKASF